MIRGMYSAASALDAAMQRQDVNSENLAHVSTPGYRAKGILFQSFDQVLDGVGASIGGVRAEGSYTNFHAGVVHQTGNQFDLALDPDVFLSVQGPNGPVYTRNGSFHLGAAGQLVSEGNYPLLGSGGPIAIPPEAGQVTIGQDGTVSADGNPIGQVRLTRFETPQQLRPVGPTLFDAPPEAGAQPADMGLRQGYLESSNVSPANAMVDMIQAARYFEAAQRALRAISESLQLNTRPTS